MRVFFAFVFLCLLTYETQSSPMKEYNIKILSDFDIETIDIKGQPVKDTADNLTSTAAPPAPLVLSSSQSSPSPPAPNKAKKEVAEEDDK